MPFTVPAYIFRGLGLSYTFRLRYMPYKTGKGIMYLISRKIELMFSFQPEKIFFSAKSKFSFLFGVFLAFLDAPDAGV